VPHTVRLKLGDLPLGWLPDRLSRLLKAKGPWLVEALKQMPHVFTRTKINAFGSKRAFYQQAKMRLA
jgi:hypothetical protein